MIEMTDAQKFLIEFMIDHHCQLNVLPTAGDVSFTGRCGRFWKKRAVMASQVKSMYNAGLLQIVNNGKMLQVYDVSDGAREAVKNV